MTLYPPAPPPRLPLAVRGALVALLAFCLSWYFVRAYGKAYRPQVGWTKLILFGQAFAGDALPRLRQTPHYEDPVPTSRYGYDGQYYAQVALDPTLRDPGFERALDSPVYRARRIGLPAIAYCLGWGEPARILQAYALANLLFWFVLLAALIRLCWPWTVQQLLCLAAALLGYGVIASMERALVDLPAAAMLFAGAAIGSWGGCAAFALAVLTRETSVLGACLFFEPRRALTSGGWKQQLVPVALAVVPLAAWLVYVRFRFHGAPADVGKQNFALPLVAMSSRLAEAVQQFAQNGLGGLARHARHYRQLAWLYMDFGVNQILSIVGLFFQGLYLVLRRNPESRWWLTGICYAALGAVLGSAVWEQTSAAARVLLPMTICFYLLLARERALWFWPFFILGSLSVPFGMHEFWTLP